MMLAADAGAAVANSVPAANPATNSGESILLADAPSQRHNTARIAFVDATLDDLDVLVADLPSDTELVLLDPQRDLIDQVTVTLNARRGVQELHIVTHGQDGGLILGDQVIDAQSFANRSSGVNQWSHALTASADLLIYGCNVGASQDGRALGNLLSRLTSADVALSTDRTGAQTGLGDWDLEYQVGQIQAGVLFSESLQQRYRHTLDITVNAWGRTGTETFELLVDDEVVLSSGVEQTWQQFTYQSDEFIDVNRVQVRFTNDAYDPSTGFDRNLHVDNIVVNGEKFESESASTFSTGTWLPSDGVVPGFGRGEVLNANGSFFYGQVDEQGDEQVAETLDFQGREFNVVDNTSAAVYPLENGGSILSVTPGDDQDGVVYSFVDLTAGQGYELTVGGETRPVFPDGTSEPSLAIVGVDFYDANDNKIGERSIQLREEWSSQTVSEFDVENADYATIWVWTQAVSTDGQVAADISDIQFRTIADAPSRTLGDVLQEFNQTEGNQFANFQDGVFVSDSGQQFRFAANENGSDVLVVRLNDNGDVDASFGDNGLAIAPGLTQTIPVTDRDIAFAEIAGSDPPTTSTATGRLEDLVLAIDAHERVTIAYDIAGNNTPRFAPTFNGIATGTGFTRFTSDGQLDASFGDGGSLIVDYQEGVSVLVEEAAFDADGQLFLLGPQVQPTFTIPLFGPPEGVADTDTTLRLDGNQLVLDNSFSFRTELQVFDDLDSFLAQGFDLTFEDFETPSALNTPIRFDGDLSSSTDNGLVSPGDIADGIVITPGNSSGELIFRSPLDDNNGNFPSQVLTTPGAIPGSGIVFTEQVNAVALDLFSVTNPIFDLDGSITVNVFGPDRLLNSLEFESTREGTDFSPAFVGIASPDVPITRIEYVIGGAVWAIDNLRFG